MTVALSLKVNDGLVLAADSATTLIAGDGSVANVYNSGNKLFNLVKGWPIGATTWGAGSIGVASVATLAKDLRRRLSGKDPTNPSWRLDPSAYTIQEVADRVRAFLYDELYLPTYSGTAPELTPVLGFCVAGYSAGAALPEIWVIEMGGGRDPTPQPVASADTCLIDVRGQPEAVFRLVVGFGTRTADALRELGVPDDQIKAVVGSLRAKLEVQLLAAPMPIQDAIELAAYLVDVTIGFMRFSPGATTVAGPVDIAAITKHEGFKWVQRKFYYQSNLNPQEER